MLNAFRVFPGLFGEIYGQRATGPWLIQPWDSYLLSSQLPQSAEPRVGSAGPGCAGNPPDTDLRNFAVRIPPSLPPVMKTEGRTRGEDWVLQLHITSANFFPGELPSGWKLATAPGHCPRPVTSRCQDRIKPLKTSGFSKRDGN